MLISTKHHCKGKKSNSTDHVCGGKVNIIAVADTSAGSFLVTIENATVLQIEGIKVEYRPFTLIEILSLIQKNCYCAASCMLWAP